MSNAYMAECTGDYIWQVDVDDWKDVNFIIRNRLFDAEISRDVFYKNTATLEVYLKNGDTWHIEVKDWIPDQ